MKGFNYGGGQVSSPLKLAGKTFFAARDAASSARIDRRAAEQYRELAAATADSDRRDDYLSRSVACDASADEWARQAGDAPPWGWPRAPASSARAARRSAPSTGSPPTSSTGVRTACSSCATARVAAPPSQSPCASTVSGAPARAAPPRAPSVACSPLPPSARSFAGSACPTA